MSVNKHTQALKALATAAVLGVDVRVANAGDDDIAPFAMFPIVSLYRKRRTSLWRQQRVAALGPVSSNNNNNNSNELAVEDVTVDEWV